MSKLIFSLRLCCLFRYNPKFFWQTKSGYSSRRSFDDVLFFFIVPLLCQSPGFQEIWKHDWRYFASISSSFQARFLSYPMFNQSFFSKGTILKFIRSKIYVDWWGNSDSLQGFERKIKSRFKKAMKGTKRPLTIFTGSDVTSPISLSH